MAAYKDLIGQKIIKTTSDPGEAKTGQMWYNSTTGTLRGLGVVEAWISAPATLNKTNNGAGAGTQTASLTFGGRNPPGPAFVATTEEYNGSGWSAGGALNTARSYSAGFGTQTAAVAAGGRIDAPGTSTNATEEYNGSSWTTVNNMGTGRRVGGSAGIVQTAGLAIGGGPPGVGTTEHYDGTNWTSGGALNTARFYLAGFGTLTSAVAAGGNGGESAVEEYNGSSWTTATSLGTGRTQLGSSGSSETDGIVFGGEAPGPTVKADAESYNGTSWTEGPNLATARRGLSGSSGHSASAALATAGYPTYNLTEEFNKSSNTLTAAAWSSAANMPYVVQRAGASGTVDAAFVFGGHRGPSDSSIGPPTDNPTTNTCLGSASIASWTNGPALNTGRSSMGALGTQTASMCIGGDPYRNESETYNGSSWTEGPNLPAGRQECAACGTTSAALLAGGSIPPYTGTSFEYDGSNWTAGGTNPAVMTNTGAVGSVTAALVAAGYVGPPPSTAYSSATYHYDGSSWTSGGSLVLGTGFCRMSGVQTAAILMNGSTPSSTSNAHLTTQQYDGTNWVTGATRSQDNSNRASSGTAPAAGTFSAGGYHNPSPGAGYLSEVVEEYVGETSTIKIDTFQTS